MSIPYGLNPAEELMTGGLRFGRDEEDVAVS
jgi:hypothetical protein